MIYALSLNLFNFIILLVRMNNYDILDKIISYLDIKSTINLLLSSKDIYYMYYENSRRCKSVMSRKIIKYFNSLNRIPINIRLVSSEDYKSLYKIYNHFYKHNDAPISDMLIYLCDIRRSDKYLFKCLILYCKFSKRSKDLKYWNMLGADDIIYLLMFACDISIIIKSIHIESEILMDVINYKLRYGIWENKYKDVLLLFDYLLFKHFFRTSRYIEDIITDIICEVINVGEIYILNKIYAKQKYYKFKVDYQIILTKCIKRMSLEMLEIINLQMNVQNINSLQRIIIKKEDIMYLMTKKSYKILLRIIELYLGSTITMNGYMNYITPYIDYTNKECLQLLDYIEKLKN